MRVSDVIEAAAYGAPPPRHSVDDIVAAGKRYQRGRRIRMTAGALSLIAVVGLVNVGLSAWNGAPPIGQNGHRIHAVGPAGASQNRQSFDFTFSGYTVGRLVVRDPLVSTVAYQMAEIAFSGEPRDPTARMSLTVYRPDRFDIDAFGGVQDTFHGQHGRGHDVADEKSYSRSWAWEYKPDSWAVIETTGAGPGGASVAEIQALAKGFTVSTPTSAKVPFEMSYVSDGFAPLMIESQAQENLPGIAAAAGGVFAGVQFRRSLPTMRLAKRWDKGFDDTTLSPGAIELTVMPASMTVGPTWTGCPDEKFCMTLIKDQMVQIWLTSDGTVPQSELLKILAGVRLKNVTDHGTWLSVDSALPAR